MTVTAPTPTIGRDHWGRPLIIPESGGKPVAYSRVTTYIKVIEDQFGLQQWMQRKVAKGLALRKDLLLAAQTTPEDDKKRLNQICDEAREAANASGAATIGTALHSLAETMDRGLALPDGLDPATSAIMSAYGKATAGLRHDHIEQFCVIDTLKVGGTPDRVVTVDGQTYIADIKTGNITFGALSIAMQLALYARSFVYHPDGTRDVHGASTNRGIVIHLPAVTDPDDAECTLHWIDLEAGWEAVKVATQVREQRKVKFAALTEPFDGKPSRPSLRLAKADEAKTAAPTEHLREKAKQALEQALTVEAARAVYGLYDDVWDDALTDIAKRRVAELSA
jgi:hypothetical protein